jgi:hypothetical protein
MISQNHSVTSHLIVPGHLSAKSWCLSAGSQTSGSSHCKLYVYFADTVIEQERIRPALE